MFFNKYIKYRDILVIVLIALVGYKLIDNYQMFLNLISTTMSVISPFIYAMIFAYCINPIMNLFERKLKMKRGLSILSTYLLIGGAIVIGALYIVPSIVDSIISITSEIPKYMETVQGWINEALKNQNLYDLIIVDSTDPIGPGEGLFTREFYKNCYESLTDKGILVNQGESPYYDMNKKEMKRSNEKLKDIFPICEVYQYMIPTYPSGYWFFGFASKKLHPVNDFDEGFYNSLNLNDRYYNKDVHKASFALPNYVKELLK